MQKLLTIATLITPILIAIIGGIGAIYLNSINQKLSWRRHDFEILQEFNKTYNDKDTRSLAMLHLQLLDNKEIKVRTRNTVTWDLLKKLVKNESNLGQKYKFDKNNDDTYYLAGNLSEWFLIDKKSAERVWKTLVTDGPEIYKNYSSRDEFLKLLTWMRDENPGIKNNAKEPLPLRPDTQ